MSIHIKTFLSITFAAILCMVAKVSYAQAGFNHSFDFNEFVINRFNDVVVKGDKIIAQGNGQDSTDFAQVLFFAQFDTLGNFEKKTIVKDSLGYNTGLRLHENRMLVTSDGGILCLPTLNYTGHDLLVKLDSNLNVEYQRYIVDTLHELKIYVTPVEVEGAYLLFGHTKDAQDRFYSFIEKVDKEGNVLWQKLFGVHPNKYKIFAWIYKKNDDRIIVSGQIFNNPGIDWQDYSPWVLEVDADGNIVWEWEKNDFGDTSLGVSYAGLVPLTTGNWLAQSSIYIGDHPYIGAIERYENYNVLLDSAFNEIRTIKYGASSGDELFFDRIPTPDGGMIGCGFRGPHEISNTFPVKGWVMRFDAQGDSLWEWAGKMDIPMPRRHEIGGLDIMESGSIVTAGWGRDSTGSRKCWLLKLSPDGCVDTIGCNTVSVPNIAQKKNSIMLYPNPSSDEIWVSNSGKSTLFSYKIYDMQGNLRLSHRINDGLKKHKIDVRSLQGGVYAIEFVDTDGGRYVQKLLIQK